MKLKKFTTMVLFYGYRLSTYISPLARLSLELISSLALYNSVVYNNYLLLEYHLSGSAKDANNKKKKTCTNIQTLGILIKIIEK